MQSFISSLTDFIIGFLGFFVSSDTGRFVVVFGLVVWAIISCVRFVNGR